MNSWKEKNFLVLQQQTTNKKNSRYFSEKGSGNMARKKIIAGNWKMNKTPSEAVALVNELKPLVANDEVDVVFCVPAIDIIPCM